MNLFVVNDRGSLAPNLWLCKDSWNPLILKVSNQFVSFFVDVNDQVIGLSAIYASTNYFKRGPS